MKNKNLRFAVFGIILLLFIGVTYLAFTMKKAATLTEERKQNAANFSKIENQPPDSLLKNRLARGEVIKIDGNLLTLNTYVYWPEKRSYQTIGFLLTDHTQFLCWPASYTGADGKKVNLEDAFFSINDESKLFYQGERYVSRAEAELIIQKKPSVMLALEKNYIYTGRNNIFQVAIFGCQDE